MSNKKPNCPLIGQDGNIFNLMAIASRTLREHDMAEQATEMCERIRNCGNYYSALGVIGEYIGRIYICINKSPQYVIREEVNTDNTMEAAEE